MWNNFKEWLAVPRHAYTVAHGTAALLHFVSVLVLGLLSENENYGVPLKIHYNAWMPGPGQTDCDEVQCVSMPASVVMAEVNLFWGCIIFGAWSALCHLVAVYWINAKTNVLASQSVSAEGDINPDDLRAIRAIDYSVSASVMILVVYIISGGSDFTAAITSAGLQAAVILIDYFGRSKASFIGAFSVYVLIWVPLFLTFDQAAYSGQVINGLESATAPKFVILIIVGIAVAFTCFAIARVWTARASFEKEEAAFISLSLTAKTALHWTLYNGILNRPKRLACEDVSEPVPIEDPTTNVQTALIVSVSIGLTLGLIMYNFVLGSVKAHNN